MRPVVCPINPVVLKLLENILFIYLAALGLSCPKADVILVS